MNKSGLIEAIATKSNLTKVQAGHALDAVISTIGETLAAGDNIALVGFGTFSVKVRQARIGRNPKTRETINIPETKVPGFKAGKGLKDALDGVVKETKPKAAPKDAATTKAPAAKTTTKTATSAKKSSTSKK